MNDKYERYKRNYPVSWDQLHRDTKALSWRLHDLNKTWKGIVTITRGGLVPAAVCGRLRGAVHSRIADRLTHGRAGHAHTYLPSPIADPFPYGSTSHTHAHLASHHGHSHGPPH